MQNNFLIEFCNLLYRWNRIWVKPKCREESFKCKLIGCIEKQQFHSEGAEGWGRYTSIKSWLFCRDALKKMFRQELNVTGLAHRTLIVTVPVEMSTSSTRIYIRSSQTFPTLNICEQIHLSVSASAVYCCILRSCMFPFTSEKHWGGDGAASEWSFSSTSK